MLVVSVLFDELRRVEHESIFDVKRFLPKPQRRNGFDLFQEFAKVERPGGQGIATDDRHKVDRLK